MTNSPPKESLKLLSIEEALSNPTFLKSIIEHLPDMVFVKEASELRFIMLNKAGEDLLGYAREELIGKNDYDFFPQEEADFFTAKDRAVLENRSLLEIVEEPIHTRRHGTRYLHTKKIPILDGAGQPRFLLGISEDITDRKNAQEAVYLRQLSDTMPQIVWAARPDGQIDYFNRRWYEFIGSSSDEKAFDSWAAVIHPEDRTIATSSWRRSVGSGETFQVEHRLHDQRTAEYRWHLNRAVPVRDVSGRIVRWFGTCTDIHDRKMAEHILEARVAERTRELEVAAQEKAAVEYRLHQGRSIEAMGRLAGSVAHDFNNLITGIQGVAENLLSQTVLEPAQREDLREIMKASERAASLTKQLLAFGRRQRITPKVLNINGVIQEMQTLVRRLIGADIEIDLALAPDLGCVRMDPAQLEQILLNTVLNARDAMSHGGRIRISTENHVVETPVSVDGASPQSAWVILKIVDNGAGMEPEILAHAFEPFYTTKGKDKGTGLGLATIYGIVRQNKGQIDLKSRAGEGTEVTISLPRVSEDVERTPMPEPTAAPALMISGKETILVVEDEDLVRRTVVNALTKAGYHVLQARHAQEALAVSDQHQAHIDLLLTDVIMPGLNGRQLAESLCPKRLGMKVLYMSGYPEDVIVTRGVLQPGIEFIEKAFRVESLCQKVRAILDQKKTTLNR